MKLTARQKNILSLLGLAGLFAFLLLFEQPTDYHADTICLFRIITGYPCPGCGIGRGMALLLHLQFYEALMMNPLAIPFTIGGIAAVPLLIYDIIKNKETAFNIMKHKLKINIWFLIFLVILTLANWYWNILKFA